MNEKQPQNQQQLERSLPLSVAGFNKRRLLWIAVLAVATIGVLLVLGDLPTTLGTIKRADWQLVGLAMLVHYSGFGVRGHRWQLLLRAAGYRLSYRRVISVLLGGWFVSALLPARLGEVFRMAALRLPQRKDDIAVPVADSLSTIILERALDMIALLSLGALFGYLALGAALPRWITTSYLITIGILAALAIGVLVAPGALSWIASLSANRLWATLVAFAQEIVVSLRSLPAHPRIALVTVLESGYIWLCDALVLWLVLIAVGVHLSFGSASFVALTVDITAAVPLTPGGMGQIEAAYSALLALIAVAPAGIAAAVLLTRIITYWSFLLFSGAVMGIAGLGGILNKQSQEDIESVNARIEAEL